MTSEKTISEVLYQIYAPPRRDSFFDHVLAIFENYIPAVYSGYSFSCLNDKTYKRQVAHNLRDGCEVDVSGVESMFKQKHPFWPYYMLRNTAPVLTTLDVISQEKWKTSEFYLRLSRPSGVMHDSSIRFYTGNRCVSYTFHAMKPMSSDHRRLLEMIAPHLNNAYTAYSLQREGIKDNLAEKRILFSADGKVEECSQAALDVINSYYPGDTSHSAGCLPEAISCWVEVSISKWNSRHRDISVPMKLALRKEGAVLNLGLVRLRDMWVLSVEEFAVRTPYRILMENGLTQRESEIMLWASQGKKNNEIAIILRVATSTVRKHMEHILEKLHCENRGAATQMVMEIIESQCGGCLPVRCLTCAYPECRNCLSY